MKKMCVIHITDLHWNPLNRVPVSAKENYHSIVKDEFNELKFEINKLKLLYSEIIICVSGDIFNLKKQSSYSPKDITYYVNLVEDIFEGCKVYMIYGNHDANTEDTIIESAYNLLCKATKNIIDVSNKTIYLGGNITISGIPYYSLDTTVDKIKSLNLNNNQKNIVLLHTDIFSNDSEASWMLEKYLTYKSISEYNTNIDFALLGHIHKSTKPMCIGKTNFSKPHAFSRMSKDYLSKEEIEEYYPGYAIIDFDTNSISYEYIKKYKASSLLDFNELEKIKENSSKLNSFMEQIREQYGTVENCFSIDNPDDVYNNTELNKEIREILNKYLCL